MRILVVSTPAVQMVVAVMVAKLESVAKLVVVTDVAVSQKTAVQADKFVFK